MTIPIITLLPPAPSRQDTEETFVPKADALLAQLPTFVEETNASITEINNTADQVTADKATTGQYLLEAETARDAAISSSVYKGTWEGKTSAGVIGESYSYQGSYIYRLNVNLANISTSVPSPTNTNWQLINVVPFEAPCKPTLDLDFANQKAVIYSKLDGFVEKPFSDIVTQGRATAGTSVDAIGGITEFAAGENRFTFDGETGEALGYLSEESRTNLLTYSEDFTNAAWVKTRTSFSGVELLEDSSNNTHVLYQTLAMTSGVTVCCKFRLKENQRNEVSLGTNAGAQNTLNSAILATFDLSNGDVIYEHSGSVNATITPVHNGYYDCCITFTTNSTNVQPAVYLRKDGSSSYQGEGVSAIFVERSQLEVGSFPTSYIKTLGTAVNRVADSMTRTLGQEWNPNEGTLVVHAEYFGTDNNSGGSYVFSNGSASNRIGIFFDSSGDSGSAISDNISMASTVGGVTNLIVSTVKGAGTGFHVVAVSFDHSNITMCVDGVFMGSDNISGLPSVDRLDGQGSGLGNVGTRTKGIRYYPRAFDALTLQRLSRIQ